MDTSSLPDWSKIGRRIGKRLKEILVPPENTGPSTEQRRRQRLRDVVKGFAYFDTFDELFNWTPRDLICVQQANTPLLRRSATQVYDQEVPSTKVILCHDYHGGYHEYEGIRPPSLLEEPYSCRYLQYLDTFIYFSHKLVCCPPPTWINLLHRNGVKALGTFLVEPQTLATERMLECDGNEYRAAKQLAAMAESIGFDGWLLNIEKRFPSHVEDFDVKLSGFIGCLRRLSGPDRLVIWYDALTTDNEVEYQNSLSRKNVAFARSADQLLTNYKWSAEELHQTQIIAALNDIELSNISFGIDVWAQNTNMPGPPRITYPARGGGGTNTGLVSAVSFKFTAFTLNAYGNIQPCSSI